MFPQVLFLFGAVFSCGAANDAARAAFGLYAGFQQRTPPTVRQALEDELAAILTPIGPTPQWRDLGEVRPGDRWRSVVVVHFKGACDVSDLTPYAPYRWTLGRTYLNDSGIIPFSDIYCNSIRAYMASALARMDPPSRAFAYGRAIARVLAHELYHVLGKTSHHPPSGLAEAVYTPQELAAEEFSFQDKDVERLRAALAPRAPRSAAPFVADSCGASGR